jgi:hypothetical protein
MGRGTDPIREPDDDPVLRRLAEDLAREDGRASSSW